MAENPPQSQPLQYSAEAPAGTAAAMFTLVAFAGAVAGLLYAMTGLAALGEVTPWGGSLWATKYRPDEVRDWAMLARALAGLGMAAGGLASLGARRRRAMGALAAATACQLVIAAALGADLISRTQTRPMAWMWDRGGAFAAGYFAQIVIWSAYGLALPALLLALGPWGPRGAAPVPAGGVGVGDMPPHPALRVVAWAALVAGVLHLTEVVAMFVRYSDGWADRLPPLRWGCYGAGAAAFTVLIAAAAAYLRSRQPGGRRLAAALALGIAAHLAISADQIIHLFGDPAMWLQMSDRRELILQNAAGALLDLGPLVLCLVVALAARRGGVAFLGVERGEIAPSE